MIHLIKWYPFSLIDIDISGKMVLNTKCSKRVIDSRSVSSDFFMIIKCSPMLGLPESRDFGLYKFQFNPVGLCPFCHGLKAAACPVRAVYTPFVRAPGRSDWADIGAPAGRRRNCHLRSERRGTGRTPAVGGRRSGSRPYRGPCRSPGSYRPYSPDIFPCFPSVLPRGRYRWSKLRPCFQSLRSLTCTCYLSVFAFHTKLYWGPIHGLEKSHTVLLLYLL